MFLIDWLIDWLSVMCPHCTSNFLVQCWSRYIQTKLQIMFLWTFFCGLWANIAQVIIFLCNVSQARSRVDFIGYFPAKRWYFALGQYCQSNFVVECCLRHIYTTSARWYSYAMLGASWTTQHRVFTYHHIMPKMYQGNTERDFFLYNVVRSVKGNTT